MPQCATRLHRHNPVAFLLGFIVQSLGGEVVSQSVRFMSSSADDDVGLPDWLNKVAVSEIGEPESIEDKLSEVRKLRARVLQLPEREQLKDLSASNLIRFLRLSKFREDEVLRIIIEYVRFFKANKDLHDIKPHEEFNFDILDVLKIYSDIPEMKGKVVVCVFPRRALPHITPEIHAANPRLLLRFNVWMFDVLSRQKQIQVCGMVLLNSFADAGLPAPVSLSKLVNISERKLVLAFFSILSIRLQAALVFDEPPLFTWIWYVVKHFVQKKIRDRFSLNGGNYTALDESIGREVRLQLDEPFRSLGEKGGKTADPQASPWLAGQIGQPIST